jgi:CheY-like chemotaxis protein
VIRLPEAGPEHTEPPASVTDRQAPVVSGRVLVIDDEKAVRRAFQRILRDHEVLEAGSGDQARALLSKDQRFDVIFCDMMMPRVSGIDLHKWLRERYPDLARRLVFVTGGAFTPNTRAYLEKVDNLHVEKPLATTNLKKIVAERVNASGSPDGEGG